MQTPDDIDLKIGAALKRLRNEAGQTQAQVAAATGVTFQQIQKYERGLNRIAISTLPAMCKALGVSPAEFVAEAMDDQGPGVVPGAAEMQTLFFRMDYHQRDALLRVARAVAAGAGRLTETRAAA